MAALQFMPVLGLFAMICAFILSTTAESTNAVMHTVTRDEIGSRSAQALLCTQKGASLASDHTPATHRAVLSTMRCMHSAETTTAYAHLGASVLGGNCPSQTDRRPSLRCLWSWTTGRFQRQPLPFYRGNARPSLLAGGGPVNHQIQRWKWGFVEGGSSHSSNHSTMTMAQVAPGEEFHPYLVLGVGGGARGGWWADNAAEGGLSYSTTGEMYSLCRYEAESEAASRSVVSAKAQNGFVPLKSIWDDILPGADTSQISAFLRKLRSTTDAPFGTYEATPSVKPNILTTEPPKSGSDAVVWIVILVVLIVVVVAGFVCCCCQERIIRLVCPPKSLVSESDGDKSDDDDNCTSEFGSRGHSTGTKRSGSHVGSSNAAIVSQNSSYAAMARASSMGPRRSLVDQDGVAVLDTVSVDFVREGGTVHRAPAAPTRTQKPQESILLGK